MKTATFFQAALVLGAAAVMATSCNKEEKANVLTDDGLKSVVLKIDLGQTATKAMEPSDSWNTVEGSEVTPDSIAIYFTDANGIIKYAYKAESTSTGKAQTVWDNFRTGVRFIGMEGISRVYAIANGADLVQFTNGEFISDGSTSTNINTFNVDIERSGANLGQFSVPYAGADVTLEDAGTVNEGTDDEVVINPDGEGGPYYSANISIRPVLSRLEINKVSIQESGTLYFSVNAETGVLERCNADDDKAMYKFDYSGFDAVLTGVYMSNFYRDAKLIPVPSSLNSWDLFANPGGTSPIVAGDWAALASETELMDIARYTGWNGASYEALAPAYDGGTSGSIHSLFDGSTNGGNKVIPFHFLFPYKITDTGAVSTSPVDAATPNLSFQFIPGEAKDIQITNCQYKNQGSWENITDQSIITMLKGEVMWPHTIGQTNEEVYANVVNFSSDPEGNTIVDITTGKIYRIQEVLVTPDALATTTQSTDASNIIVEVSIIPFTAENVYPVFE